MSKNRVIYDALHRSETLASTPTDEVKTTIDRGVNRTRAEDTYQRRDLKLHLSQVSEAKIDALDL